MKLSVLPRHFLLAVVSSALLFPMPLTATAGLPVAQALPVIERTLPTDQAPLGVDVDPAANRVYVANVLGNGESGSYSIVDTKTGGIINVAIPNPQDVVVNRVTGKAYISTGDNRVVVVTRDNPTVIARDIFVGRTPKWMAVNPRTNRIYVAIHGDRALQVIDGNTDQIIDTIGFSDRFPVEPAIDLAINRIYVTAFGSANRVGIVDGNTNSRVGDLPVRGDQVEIDVDQESGRVFVTSNDDLTGGLVTAFDRNGTKLAERPLCNRVTGLTFNDTSDHLFVSCEYGAPNNERSRTISVLDSALQDVSMLRYSDMIPGPAMTVDETCSIVYVANTYSKVTSAGQIMLVIQDDRSAGPTATSTNPVAPSATAVSPTNRVFMPLIQRGAHAGGC